MALVAIHAGVGCGTVQGMSDVPDADGTDVVDGSSPDGPGADAALLDSAPLDGAPADAGIDAAQPVVWAFVTNAAFTGGFGSKNGARVTADIRCEEMYDFAFKGRGCGDIRAVIQIDDVDDTIGRMSFKFGVPENGEVFRATDGTRVSGSFNDLVDPTKQLIDPVIPSADPLYFWSGRNGTSNPKCDGWQSESGGLVGVAGDATKTNSWMSQAGIACNNFSPHLLCVCW